MSTTDRPRPYTYEDLAAFPDDGLRRELIDGELIVSPSPSRRHQLVVAFLVMELGLWARAHGAQVFPAPMDVRFSRRTVLEPDVLLLSREQVAAGGDPLAIEVSPVLVVEVSSPATRRTDLVRKRRVYEREGCREFWFVDLDADRVEVYRRDGGAYGQPLLVERGARLTSPQLDGFDVAVDDLLGEAGEDGDGEGGDDGGGGEGGTGPQE